MGLRRAAAQTPFFASRRMDRKAVNEVGNPRTSGSWREFEGIALDRSPFKYTATVRDAQAKSSFAEREQRRAQRTAEVGVFGNEQRRTELLFQLADDA